MKLCALVHVVFGFSGLAIITSPTASKADKIDKQDKKSAQKSPPADQEIQVSQVDLTQPITLEKAVQIALQNHNSLAIARSQVNASKAAITGSKSAYYPQLAPSYTYTSQVTTQRFNGKLQTGTFEQSVAQIGFTQNIYDMGKREENVLISKYNARAAEFNVSDTRQVIVQNVSSAYYDLKRLKELVRVADASVERAQTTLDATTAQVAAGASPKKDILQAQADFENARVQQLLATNNVKVGQATLKNAMGILSVFPVIVTDEPLPPPPSDPDTKTAADYVKTAFNNRPDLRRESASIDANRHNVKIANINAGFQVGASVTEGYRVDPDPGENRSFNTSFSYPLFDGGASKAAVRQAKEGLNQARFQLEQTRQNIQLSVEQSYANREVARSSISATQTAVKAARLNYESAKEAQKEGAVSGTLLDVITAQALLITAETNAVNAIYDFYTADAQLKRAIGSNDPVPGGK